MCICMYVYNECLYNCHMYAHSEELYSPEELLAMMFNSSRQIAQDYAGTYTYLYM